MIKEELEKEELEKEAKEYVDNNFYDLIEKVQEIAKVAFKDGAEFGYNKANE